MLPLPFPKEAVRDLLGITRALYRAENTKTPIDRRRLEGLRQIGHLYREALENAVKYPPDSMGRRSALSMAERATAALGAFVADSELMAPAVAATAARLSRRGR